jgi:hypothetical protein
LKDIHVPVCHAASLKFPSTTIPAPHKAVTDDGAGLGVKVAVYVGDAGEPVGVDVCTGVSVDVRDIVTVYVGVCAAVLVYVGDCAPQAGKLSAGLCMLVFTKFPSVERWLSSNVPPEQVPELNIAELSGASENDHESQLILFVAIMLMKFVAFAVSSVPPPDEVLAAHSVTNIGRTPT